MEMLSQILNKLTPEHSSALKWFIEHAGTEQPWTATLDGGKRLLTKAKGIFKPSDSEYALSIRQVLNGPYPDREPVSRHDGTWVYQYYQEGNQPNDRDKYYTNLGLLKCLNDGIPVGVLRQTSRSPTVRYQVLGVAIVAGWESGYFFLEGFSPQGFSHGKGPHAEIEILKTEAVIEDLDKGEFQPSSLLDSRKRTLASIVRRQGQKEFRGELLEAYAFQCSISQWNVIDTLEAAHIIPYSGVQSNHISNGLLLRSDLHILFDLGKLAVNTGDMTVMVSPALYNTQYAVFHGTSLTIPPDLNERPSKAALDQHREWAGL